MRVVEWPEFKALPEGTIFQEIARDGGSIHELMIFGGASDSVEDFVAAGLLPEIVAPDVFHTDGLAHMGIKREDAVEVIHTPTGFGRDGLYQHDGRRWLVWEQADRARLAEWLLDPEKAVREQNDEAHAFVLLPIE